jgi:hypothetical protein
MKNKVKDESLGPDLKMGHPENEAGVPTTQL